MLVEFTPRAFARGLGLPDAVLKNMLVEATPGGPGQTVRFSRPGLVPGFSYGAGPNRGLFAQKGLVGDAIFTVSGPALYVGPTNVGAITGTDLARSATSKDQRVVVADTKAWLYQTSGFSQIVNPNLPATVDVIYFDNKFLYFQKASGRYYYSAEDDAANIDGLAFENAELKPDPNVGALVVGDQFYVFGTDTIEPTFATGDPNTPFERAQSRSFERGCASRDTIKLVDNTAFWVGNDRMVYRAAGAPERISSHSVEGLLKACANISGVKAFTFSHEGHPLYGLNIPGQETVVYDVSSSEWDSWESYQHGGLFRGVTSLDLDGTTYIGDDTTADVWTTSRSVFTDGASPLIRVATAFVPVEGGRPRCDSLTMSCAKGVGTVSGNGSAPAIEMAYSDDMGRTFGRWRQGNPGALGQYSKRVTWSRLGRMRAPGRVFRFRCSDPTVASFANLSLNGGRA